MASTGSWPVAAGQRPAATGHRPQATARKTCKPPSHATLISA
ncbi:hypothetical protein GcM1_250026 [Golovinomyces cichoracearum]|uniref:Uncharacterized protein n=1 Tax=Golovinomyces cichoracearum TaxID=62708 RepID=A0A420IAJ4_9PEZI|nr:hypothetical protein GcM1_250026 [Golovinomyces cichoracearum]